jgi:hypothetical protein
LTLLKKCGLKKNKKDTMARKSNLKGKEVPKSSNNKNPQKLESIISKESHMLYKKTYIKKLI